jgi:pimeloyl-ACP methyl ester carboxylesterase
MVESESEIEEREIEFQSAGETCRGLFVRPAGAERAPLIVLGHGLGGVYEMRLDAYARRFAQAGYAALTFDYRRFGRSDGHPRHLLARDDQQQDFDAAIEFGKTLEGVDPARIILWGTSLAGGHVIDVSSRRQDLSASIIQAPFTDGPASARQMSLPSLLGLGCFIVADAFARLLGLGTVLIPLAGTPGTPALMTKPDVVRSVLRLMPPGSRLSGRLSWYYRRFAERRIALPDGITTSDAPEPFPVARLTGSILLPSGTALVSGVSAIFGLKICFWRPGKKLRGLRRPMLVCVCERDSVAPPERTLAYARAASACQVRTYPYGHFDIYVGDEFEEVLADQLDFLQRTVPSAGETRTPLSDSRPHAAPSEPRAGSALG